MEPNLTDKYNAGFICTNAGGLNIKTFFFYQF